MTTTTLDRSAINRALAKALAYSQCGRHDMAERWAARLVALLECQGILGASYATDADEDPR